jgi:membrane-associated phospholipid phosphatase
MTPSRFQKPIRFLQNRLSPHGYAGLHLTVGVLVVLICGWCFGEIAEDVSHGDPIVQVDRHVGVWFHQHASPSITQVARTISFFGSVGWLTVASIGVALFLVSRRDWLNATLFALIMVGGSTLNVVLKHFFHRERPALENPLVTLSSYGFPSGHTMGAILFYGFLALLAWKNVRNRAARLACVVGACFCILLVGLTRIYLGAHYLTDVLGALATGLFWLLFCWTAFETLRWRRHSTRSPNFDHRTDHAA